jgi:hypothetical protein
MTTSYCLIWHSPNLEGQVPIFIFPRNRVAQLPPGTVFPFRRLLRLVGLRRRYFNPPPHRADSWLSFRLFCDRRSVGQSVIVSVLSGIRGFLVPERPSWREDGIVIYSYNLLSLSGPSPAELMTTFYCLIWDSFNLEGQVPQEQGGPNIPPGTGFPFLRLLRLAWLRRRYCNPPRKVKVTLRLTVSRPVRLDVRRPSGTSDQFFFLLEILFRQLWVCYFEAPSLATSSADEKFCCQGPTNRKHVVVLLPRYRGSWKRACLGRGGGICLPVV